MIFVGFEVDSGKPVGIPLAHTVVAGQTRYGKSTCLRSLMDGLPKDYHVLCLDVKDPRDFAGVGSDIPIYIENRTDPLMLKQLLEQQSHLWLRKEFPELIDLCREGDSFERVYQRVCERLEKKLHPVVRDRLKVLRLLLEKLVEDLKATPISDSLRLNNRINVMNLSKAPSEIKQLAVYSSIKHVLYNHHNVVIVLDELPDFAPQGYRTPSKRIIIEAIRKGGAKGVWLWLAGQTITGVEKKVLKQVMIWILGHQMEINEAKRTLEQIPFKTGLKPTDIMRLPVGHFIVCTDRGATLTYVKPVWIDGETARKVAVGELSVDMVKEKMEVEEVEELKYKQLYEELKANLEKRVKEEREKAFREAMQKLEELKKQWNIDELQRTIAELKDKVAEQQKIIESMEEYEEAVELLRTALSKILPSPGMEARTVEVPTEINVNVQQPILKVKVKRKPLELSQDNIEGRIAIVYAEGLLPQKAFSISQLNRILEGRFGTKEFPGNLPKVCDKFVSWGFFEKVQSGRRWDYRVRLKPEDARSKGLIKLEEKAID